MRPPEVKWWIHEFIRVITRISSQIQITIKHLSLGKNIKKKKTKKNLLEKYTVKFFQMLGLENKVQLTYNIKDIFFVFVS